MDFHTEPQTGVPAVDDREYMTVHDQLDTPRWRDRLSTMSADKDDSGLQLIATSLLALPTASVADDSEVMSILEQWVRSGSRQPAVRAIPLTSVDASLQGVVRLDVLLHYLNHPTTLYDSAPSSWGALGPLAVRLKDGRVILVDGNHRWVAALLAGRKHMAMQMLPMRKSPATMPLRRGSAATTGYA